MKVFSFSTRQCNFYISFAIFHCFFFLYQLLCYCQLCILCFESSFITARKWYLLIENIFFYDYMPFQTIPHFIFYFHSSHCPNAAIVCVRESIILFIYTVQYILFAVHWTNTNCYLFESLRTLWQQGKCIYTCTYIYYIYISELKYIRRKIKKKQKLKRKENDIPKSNLPKAIVKA